MGASQLLCALCRGHGGGDSPGVGPDSCAFDQDGRCGVHPECGGTCGDIRRPVEVARIGQAAGERRAAQPYGAADAGQFGVAQPWAALGWLAGKQRVRVGVNRPPSAAQPEAAAARVE